MSFSHVNTYWKDIDKQLMKYIDRYFEIRFESDEKENDAQIRDNERGALIGYIQSFDDKNGKWQERLEIIRKELIKQCKNKEMNEEIKEIDGTNFKTCGIVDRIKIPLKILYKSKYKELLSVEKSAIEYNDDENIQKIDIEPEKLKSAINLFALTGALANRIAHSTSDKEEAAEAYECKHQMIAYLITALYDYNKISKKKIECRFAKAPSKKDGHAYPTLTVKLEQIGKISLHYGGSEGVMTMLYDSLPSRFKEDKEAIKQLNEGNIGDIKTQNLPGVQALLDLTKIERETR